ncbi:MAG: hypothetical protein KGJ90_06280 [Patescibacteria group bacterium]|nr:hypothetical protein [Patescibacteria group bacterium]
MSVSTSASQTTVLGNGVASVFAFNFVGVASGDITVLYTDTLGNITTLAPSAYTLVLNAPATGQLWGVGGTVTYLPNGVPIANGTSLTITRSLPFTQTTSMSNQGNFYPQVTETALDLLCMQVQQVLARTGQIHGYWVTAYNYNMGDVVQDGINGADTLNFYMCAVPHTSGVWATDLTAGYWSLVINVQQLNSIVGSYLPLSGGTISGNLTVQGTTTLVTPAGGDNSTKAATTAFVQRLLPIPDTTAIVKNNADNTKQVKISAAGITTGTTRTWTAPDSDLTVTGTATTQTLSNKSLVDTSTVIINNADNTKKAAFDCSSITTVTTRTLTIPDASGVIVLSSTQKLLQTVKFETGAMATGTTIMPYADSIPQNTQGEQYMSLSITPISASSTLIIDVVWNGSINTGNSVQVALFQDSTVNALAAVAQVNSFTSGLPVQACFAHTMTSGTTSPTTFKVRAGPSSAATVTFNGQAGGRIFGGVMASSIIIREVQ